MRIAAAAQAHDELYSLIVISTLIFDSEYCYLMPLLEIDLQGHHGLDYVFPSFCLDEGLFRHCRSIALEERSG